ncbi:hypothetical protein DCAR_0312186 [Daucus carota subsp. sativus]|uniref:Uncharacterized protein n=1 Tax=Daucus carota subsp. sativus TaxID=79200 RepID=A0AAF1ARV1_DAUCS|nr:hypothetical protein DCAR_0312186 [Daucus carota subsp. sativus]
MVIKRNSSDLGLAAILCTSHAALHCYWEASSYYTSRKLQTQNSSSEEMDQFGLPFSPILNELIFPRQEQERIWLFINSKFFPKAPEVYRRYRVLSCGRDKRSKAVIRKKRNRRMWYMLEREGAKQLIVTV